MRSDRSERVFLAAIVVAVLFFTGCMALQPKEDATAETVDAAAVSSEPLHGPEAPSFVYYDFKDVPFPPELHLDPSESFVYWSGGPKRGLLSLSGWVDADSLCSFFEHYMAKDNWRFLGLLKARPTFMLFVKEGRYCVITISDGMKTRVKAWVVPTIDEMR